METGKTMERYRKQEGPLFGGICSEEAMYERVRSAAGAKGLVQTGRALPLAQKLHRGQYRKGPERLPYICHPLTMACHALALGIEEDDILAAALLHDVCEDCGVKPEELPVNGTVREAVSLLTFCREAGEAGEQAKERYYGGIRENRTATVVKLLDRCNNISTMASAFSTGRMAGYADETRRYVLPLLSVLRQRYPEFRDASFLLQYQMESLLKSIERFV